MAYKVVTRNSADVMEPTLRLLAWQAQWQGRDYFLCLHDENSSDETTHIFKRLQRDEKASLLWPCRAVGRECAAVSRVIDLRQTKD